MATLLQDLRYGFRMMARSPVVTGIAVLSLSLGIAANASMFAILNGFLFEPLPYEDQDEIMLIRTLRAGEDVEMSGGISVPNVRDLEEASRSIEHATIYTVAAQNLTGLDVPEQLSVVATTPSFFDVFGVQPSLGRGFRPEEGAEGAGNVLVLEHDFWQRRFLGDRDVLGRSVMLDGSPHTIVGVMPAEFDLIPANVHAFRPTDFAAEFDNRASRGFLAFARLVDGATPGRFQSEVDATASRLVAEYPEANRGLEFHVQPLREFFPGPTDTQLIRILTAVTVFGLLIACANIANLLLSRAEERQKEVAVRTALGAGRIRILRQMLTESVLMATVAAAVGSILAVWVVRWLQGIMPPELPAAFAPELDPEVLAATLAVAVLAGVAFGLLPALHSSASNLRESLGNGARGGTAGRRRKRIRNTFVVGEVAVALALLAGSGFLVQAFDRLANDDPGFDASGLLTFEISVLERYGEDAEVSAYQQEIVEALGAIPGVEGVAVMSTLPRGRMNRYVPYTVDGRPEPEAGEAPTASLQAVNEAYFGTMDIELLRGRLFDEGDRADGVLVAVVSDAFAEREFPGADPLGAQISFGGQSRRIVGVVENILQDRIALAGRAGEQIYAPFGQAPFRSPRFALRAAGDPLAIAGDVREAVWSVEADQPVAQLRSLQDAIDESLAGPNSIALFLSVMGGIALALAAMGIYGVMAHSVAQQQREIGIRMALGAGRGTVVSMIARSGVLLLGLGVVVGLPLTYLMWRGTMTALNLFEADLGFGYPAAMGGSLVLVGLLATVLPARRASGVAPVSALQE